MEAAPGRPRPSWATFVYYYLAALIGAVVIISGGIRVAGGISRTILPPRESPFGFESFGPLGPGVDLVPSSPREERTEGLRDALEGLLIAGVGAPVFWWHLNEARRCEGDPPLRQSGRRT